MNTMTVKEAVNNPPKWLGLTARQEWTQILNELIERQIYDGVNLTDVANYCLAHERYDEYRSKPLKEAYGRKMLYFKRKIENCISPIKDNILSVGDIL